VVATFANSLDPLRAMAAPPLLMNAEPMKAGETWFTKPELVPEEAYDAEFLNKLGASGVVFEQRSKQDASNIKGTAVMGTIDPVSRVVRGVETSGVFGFVAAY
jgi:hypothetical protein